MVPSRSRGMTPSSIHARFDPLLPFEAWQAIGVRLARYAKATPWWLGDWMAFGRFKYGRRYKDAIAITGLDYQTLRNYATVARRFEPSRRRDALTFQHHADVCALPDDQQDGWLDRAAEAGWSCGELRRQRRAAAGTALADGVRLVIDASSADRWREAARVCECDVEEWSRRVLDEAAEAILGGEHHTAAVADTPQLGRTT
jgi:hypothetical protein